MDDGHNEDEGGRETDTTEDIAVSRPGQLEALKWRITTDSLEQDKSSLMFGRGGEANNTRQKEHETGNDRPFDVFELVGIVRQRRCEDSHHQEERDEVEGENDGVIGI